MQKKKKKKGITIIGIGSNLRGHMGSPRDNLKTVLNYLSRNGLRVEKCSKIYSSRPYPSGKGPIFFNRVVIVKTNMYAIEILKRLKKIESIFGRRNLVKDSPRVLDLDLLDCRGEIIEIKEKLVIPHPKICHRKFVLYPIFEVNPSWRHPYTSQKVLDLLVKCSRNNLNNVKPIAISYLQV